MDSLTSSLSWEQSETMRLLKSEPGTQYQEAGPDDRKRLRDWLRELAQTSIIVVHFAKADGTIREMKCTLNQDYIPAASRPKGNIDSLLFITPSVDGLIKQPKKKEQLSEPKEESTLKVFDVEANAWRSFRFDRLHKITAELNFK